MKIGDKVKIICYYDPFSSNEVYHYKVGEIGEIVNIRLSKYKYEIEFNDGFRNTYLENEISPIDFEEDWEDISEELKF